MWFCPHLISPQSLHLGTNILIVHASLESCQAMGHQNKLLHLTYSAWHIHRIPNLDHQGRLWRSVHVWFQSHQLNTIFVIVNLKVIFDWIINAAMNLMSISLKGLNLAPTWAPEKLHQVTGRKITRITKL